MKRYIGVFAATEQRYDFNADTQLAVDNMAAVGRNGFYLYVIADIEADIKSVMESLNSELTDMTGALAEVELGSEDKPHFLAMLGERYAAEDVVLNSAWYALARVGHDALPQKLGLQNAA